MSWLEAISNVLAESDAPLHYSEISEKILSQGYYKTDGATPAATVNAQISSSIKHTGEESPFLRVGKGIYSLRSKIAVDLPAHPTVKSEPLPAEVEINNSDSIIQSFGMYWQRELVLWKNDPKMYGRQQALAKSVDFGHQKGIYMPV